MGLLLIFGEIKLAFYLLRSDSPYRVFSIRIFCLWGNDVKSYGVVVANASAQNKKMPDAVVKRKGFPKIKDCSKAVKYSAGEQPNKSHRREISKERDNGDYGEPAHEKIGQSR